MSVASAMRSSRLHGTAAATSGLAEIPASRCLENGWACLKALQIPSCSGPLVVRSFPKEGTPEKADTKKEHYSPALLVCRHLY